MRTREREESEREKGELETVKRVWAGERERDRATRILKERESGPGHETGIL